MLWRRSIRPHFPLWTSSTRLPQGKGARECFSKPGPTQRRTPCDLDDLCASGHRPLVRRPARASLATIDLPGRPPPVEMADTHGNRSLVVSHLVEEHSAGALRVVMEQGPQQRLLHFAQLASRTTRWTCTLSEATLARGGWHDFILLDIQFRMKSAPPPLYLLYAP